MKKTGQYLLFVSTSLFAAFATHANTHSELPLSEVLLQNPCQRVESVSCRIYTQGFIAGAQLSVNINKTEGSSKGSFYQRAVKNRVGQDLTRREIDISAPLCLPGSEETQQAVEQLIKEQLTTVAEITAFRQQLTQWFLEKYQCTTESIAP